MLKCSIFLVFILLFVQNINADLCKPLRHKIPFEYCPDDYCGHNDILICDGIQIDMPFFLDRSFRNYRRVMHVDVDVHYTSGPDQMIELYNKGQKVEWSSTRANRYISVPIKLDHPYLIFRCGNKTQCWDSYFEITSHHHVKNNNLYPVVIVAVVILLVVMVSIYVRKKTNRYNKRRYMV